jgi:hypothetical protein
MIALIMVLATGLIAGDPADDVRQASAGWREASIKQDAAALDRWLADELSYSHSGGLTQNKAEYIAAVTKGPSHYQSFHDSDTNISIYGKAAVLTGFVDVTPAHGETYRVRTLEVYVEKTGRWQMVAHQSARVGARTTR